MDNKSIWNLRSLYRLLEASDKLIGSLKNYGFTSLTSVSEWPNLIYCNSENILNDDFTLSEIIKGIKSKQIPPLIMDWSNDSNAERLKKNRIFLVDRWILMEMNILPDFSSFLIDDNYYFQNLMNKRDISDWTLVLSESLFSNKKLDENIFAYLVKENCEIFCLRKGEMIVGTAMVHYDENNVAGIYMVSVKPDFRRIGIGKLLMYYVISQIKERDISTIVLQSTREGQVLYENIGFQRTGNMNLWYKIM